MAKELIDSMASKKVGVAMAAVIAMAMAPDLPINTIVAMAVVACVHTVCQTVIDMKQGRVPPPST